MQTRWFLFGSILPDLMLILMGIAAVVYDLATGVFSLGDIMSGPSADGPPEAFTDSTIGRLFDDMFFNDPWVKAGHSIFGTPIPLITMIYVGYRLWQHNKVWGPALFWLGVGAMIHTLADIPLHTNDGPLLLWPFNWDLRFESPVSYWDPNHHGQTWSIFEMILNLLMLVWLLVAWLRRRRVARGNSAEIQT